jgi:hypothetical protein
MKTIGFWLDENTLDLIKSITQDCVNSPNTSYPVEKLNQYKVKFESQLEDLLWGFPSEGIVSCYRTLRGLCRYSGKLEKYEDSLETIRLAMLDQ